MYLIANERKRLTRIAEIKISSIFNIDTFAIQIIAHMNKAIFFQKEYEAGMLFKYGDINFVCAEISPPPKGEAECTLTDSLMTISFVNFDGGYF